MSLIQEIKELPTADKDIRKFAAVVGGVFLALGALAWFRDVGWYPIPLWIGGPLLVVGLAIPILVKPLYYIWMSLALVMGFVMTRVILTIFFFLVLTPAGLIFRILGKDPLNRRLDRNATTYWIEKKYLIDDPTRLEKFF